MSLDNDIPNGEMETKSGNTADSSCYKTVLRIFVYVWNVKRQNVEIQIVDITNWSILT
jgi:hypothetical protein